MSLRSMAATRSGSADFDCAAPSAWIWPITLCRSARSPTGLSELGRAAALLVATSRYLLACTSMLNCVHSGFTSTRDSNRRFGSGRTHLAAGSQRRCQRQLSRGVKQWSIGQHQGVRRLVGRSLYPRQALRVWGARIAAADMVQQVLQAMLQRWLSPAPLKSS